MASSSSTLFTSIFILCLLSKLSSGRSDSPVGCSKEITGYSETLPLPTLNATLHYTYDSLNSRLSILFTAIPPTPDGWIAWGVNPTQMGMVGAEVIAAFKKNNVLKVKTYYLKSIKKIIPQELSFKIWNLRAEQNSGGCISIFATLQVPENSVTLNHTWQIGGSVSNGEIDVHELDTPNFDSKGKIDLIGAGSCRSPTFTTDTMAHATHSLVGFGVFLPIGLIIPRYLDLFLSDPESLTWFYVYACFQLFGFGFGFGGWVEGIKIGWESGFSAHGIIGTVLVFFGAIQIIILFKNTNKMKYKDRLFRNIYYYTVGYLIIFLGITNNSMGVRIKNSEQSWESYYQYWLIGLNGIIVCEIFIRANCCCLGRLTRFDRQGL